MKNTCKHKTCRRENIPGQAHALTFSCFKRRPFLNRDRSRGWFVDALAAARQEHQFDLWAFVIMPEHVHLLIYSRAGEYSVSAILCAIKRPVARCALRFVRQHAPEFLPMMRDAQPNGQQAYRFWQRGGGHDRNLVTPELIRAEIDYAHANPVRRGLVASPTDWRWSSSRFYAGLDDVVLSPDTESLPPGCITGR